MHINNIATLGENKWYDGGDERFHPDNIIFDARNSNILGIISKKTGDVVWRLGPDFNENESTRKLGWIIGQHHLHMIPKGLPGEGDLLVFDNGGEGGYGVPNPASPPGVNNAHLRSPGSIRRLRRERCYLRMHPDFTVPISVLRRDFRMAIH